MSEFFLNISTFRPRLQKDGRVVKKNSEKKNKWIQNNSEKTEFSLNYSEFSVYYVWKFRKFRVIQSTLHKLQYFFRII